MLDDVTTLTCSTPGSGQALAPITEPQVVVIAVSDDPQEPSSRHLLGEIDEVRFGRGARAAHRVVLDGKRVLELRIPDPRMSGDHGRLVRGPLRWVLDDPASKNGSVVDGEATRQHAVADGSLLELGHTFLMFFDRPIEEGARDDVLEGELDPAAPALATFVGPLADHFAALARLATTPVSIVLLGETGTGKEVVARALHQLSARPGAFIAVNCGALPAALVEAELFGHRRGAFTGAISERAGLIRSAHGGTLFLDEIGELPAASQAAFLRVLQEREVVPVGEDRPVAVDVRLCAATHRDLGGLVEGGSFRQDLFARMAGFTLELPPLCERRADFGLLLHALLGKLGAGDLKFAPAALRAMLGHPWPLNIRALEKALLTAATLATRGTVELAHLADLSYLADLPGRAAPVAARSAQVLPGEAGSLRPGWRNHDDAALRERLVGLLTMHRGNVVAVSREIGARRTQVYRWARRFGIALDGFRR